MEVKLAEREYKTMMDFVNDMNLMLLNCLTYNGTHSEYTRTAKKLEKHFVRLWKKYFAPSSSMSRRMEKVQMRSLSQTHEHLNRNCLP